MTPVAIVGGGIAGLAAAWELRKQGIEPLLLEQGPKPGGVIHTERSDGFVIDSGPDSLLVHKPAALDLCAELGLTHRLVATLPPRTAYVLRRGRLVPLPRASYLGLPTQMGPFLTTRLFSWRAKARMAAERLLPPAPRESESIGSFIGRRFGQEAVDYMAEPLLAGIHAGDVHQLSIESLFPRLPELERTYGSVLRGLAATAVAPRDADKRREGADTQSTAPAGGGAFVTLRDGLGELPATLAAALGRQVIRCNARVRRVFRAGEHFVVTLADGETIDARALIVATPAWEAASLLERVEPAIASLCAGISYASSATVALAFRREQVAHPLLGTGFLVPRVERQALMAATWVTSKWPDRAPDGFVLLRAFLGGATAPEAVEVSDEAMIAAARSELSTVLGISGEAALTHVCRWRRATPQYLVGHAARIREIDDRLERLPGLHVTGSGYRGTGIPDCIADARETGRRAASALKFRVQT